MNVFCSWCRDPIKWAGIEYGVSHSICRRCCRDHFPGAVVNLAILAMGLHEQAGPQLMNERTAAEIRRTRQ